MTTPKRLFRGGPSLVPRPSDIKVDPATGLVRPGRGVSVQSVPDGLDRFGGAFELSGLPPTLTVIQTGRNPNHYEICPINPMTVAEYADALAGIGLTPPQPSTGDANDPAP